MVPNVVQSDTIEVIPESPIIIDQLNESSMEDSRTLQEIRRHRELLICSRKQQAIIITATRSLKSTTNTRIESTTLKVCSKTFKHQKEIYPTEHNPIALVMRDFNQDSYVDLAIINADSNSFSILLGNGNGTFQKQRSYSTGNESNPQKFAVGDLNDDGLWDLVIVLAGTNEIVIYFGDINNVLSVVPPYNLTHTYPYKNVSAIGVYDWNYDGFDDILIGYSDKTSPSKWFSLLLNIDDGRNFVEFNTVVTGLILPSQRGVIVEIMLSFFSSTQETEDLLLLEQENRIRIFHKLVFCNIWKANYTRFDTESFVSNVTELIIGRFDPDALDDEATIYTDLNVLRIHYYAKRMSLDTETDVFLKTSYFTRHDPTSVARLNFNDDQMDDIAILHCDGAITVFLTDYGFFDRNYLSFEINNNSNSKTCAKLLKSVDLNQDGEDDLIFIDTQSNAVRVVLNSVCDD
ncbi:unnamed protein product [Adineta ricciae]|uniref:VCBS repeat-containing protein n=1 Tax=Adineta ricciae TaxID=249248 RepID=A0A815NP78_ADIRI|nr:unnamed protein product [Adineta ricciae]